MQKQDKHRGKSKESLRYAFVSVFGFATGIISDNPLETAQLPNTSGARLSQVGYRL